MIKPLWLNKTYYLLLLLLLPSIVFSAVVINEEATAYRNNGYEAQKKGDYNRALVFYQKALAINPAYSIVYNDLGVLYETSGKKDKALAMYRRALKIDPDYPEVYFNLASLYEIEGDFVKAAYYWKKRIQMGQPNDSGTSTAKEHLRQIGQIYPEIAEELKVMQVDELLSDMLSAPSGISRHNDFSDEDGNRGYIFSKDHPAYKTGFFTKSDTRSFQNDREKEVKKLIVQMNSPDIKRSLIMSEDNYRKAEECLAKGKEAYGAGDYAKAITNFNDAAYLDPDNKETQELIESSRKKLLLK